MTSDGFGLSCPAPIGRYDRITMAHGGGGRVMQRLLDSLVLPIFDSPELAARHDGSIVSAGTGSVAITTDSYVVSPLFFPGGSIGTLAVNGTINDLAMCGARAVALTCALILEEGLQLDVLERVLVDLKATASAVGVPIVTGDTKVVEHGRCDGIYVNTAGIGRLLTDLPISPQRVQPGDAVLISGDVGRHGMAVMAQRKGFEFETDIETDCSPVIEPVEALIAAGVDVHCLRDLTRGGLASALVEIAETSGLSVEVDEDSVPVTDHVRSACEWLGFDPFYVANEGRFVAFVAAPDADRALTILRAYPVSTSAAIIGAVQAERSARVLVETLGGSRILDMLSGEQLPRIC